MTRVPTRPGVIAQNPLAVISLLIAIVEMALAYPVTKLSGSSQTEFVHFMVGFPLLLMILFFVTVWFRPGHLYSPKDYASPTDFLRGIGKGSAIPPQAAPESLGPQLRPSGIDPADAARQPNR